MIRTIRVFATALVVTGFLGAGLLAHPLTDKTAQMCDEALVLMGRIGRSDRLDEQLVEVG